MNRDQCIERVHARVAALVEYLQLEGGTASTEAARDNFPAWNETQFYYTVQKARQLRLLCQPTNKFSRWLSLTALTASQLVERTRPSSIYAARRP